MFSDPGLIIFSAVSQMDKSMRRCCVLESQIWSQRDVRASPAAILPVSTKPKKCRQSQKRMLTLTRMLHIWSCLEVESLVDRSVRNKWIIISCGCCFSISMLIPSTIIMNLMQLFKSSVFNPVNLLYTFFCATKKLYGISMTLAVSQKHCNAS